MPSGFYDMASTKREGGKIASCRQWRLGDLVLAKVNGFSAWPARYTNLFFIPICLPLFDVCNVCCCCYLHFPHQIIYFFFPILIPDCHPRVCVSVYKFSYSFISTMTIVMAIFQFVNMCRYFILNPLISKPR